MICQKYYSAKLKGADSLYLVSRPFDIGVSYCDFSRLYKLVVI